MFYYSLGKYSFNKKHISFFFNEAITLVRFEKGVYASVIVTIKKEYKYFCFIY